MEGSEKIDVTGVSVDIVVVGVVSRVVGGCVATVEASTVVFV